MADRKTKLKYRGVQIVPGERSCMAARQLTGLRLLTAQAPLQLPLKDCECPQSCKCVYRHFDDRRDGPRRENDHARVPVPFSGAERRRWRGRRDSDYR